MPSTPRYDAIVVGGGLAGTAVATLLAKRGRRVVLVEPRPEWGGSFPDQRVGAVSVAIGPRAVVAHERLGWADAYFEAVGLSLPLMVREGVTFRREAFQVIWGQHRLTLSHTRSEVAEELRREYRLGEPDLAAFFADLEAVHTVLAPSLGPVPGAEAGQSWARLKQSAAARSFASRFGRLAPGDYVRARQLADALAAYLESWRGALRVDGEPAGAWLFRTAEVHGGVVSLPAGRAGVCRLLASRFQALGGEVLRAPIDSLEVGREPSVEIDGRRVTARALILNARHRPGSPPPAIEASGLTTFVFSTLSSLVPDAMGTYLLIADEEPMWSLSRRRMDAGGGASRDLIEVSCVGRADGPAAREMAGRVERLLPFAAAQLDYAGSVRAEEIPDPVAPKLLETGSWRSRGHGWLQTARAPVWWLADESPPWFGDARDYRAALAFDGMVRFP